MRALLDTHTLVWTLTDNPKLSKNARAALSERVSEPLVSAASVMEIFTKHRLGKFPEAEGIVQNWDRIMGPPGYTFLPISAEQARLAGQMDIDHKDPFDRLLIAQSRLEGVPLISNEAIFDGFGVERIW